MEVKDILVGKSIKIYSEKNQFILENDILKLSLSKSDGTAKPIKDFKPQAAPYSCYGIVGCMEGKTQKYMVYIDEVDFISKYFGANVYKIKKFNYIPYDTDKIESNDLMFIQMMNDFLERNSLFYSDKIDLSISFQFLRKRIEIDPKGLSPNSEILRFSNDIYCWNRYLINPYNRYFKGELINEEKNKGMQYFAFPIINGFFGTCKGNEYNDNVELFLIARKDIRRSGMRFLIRGADTEGNIANCVEIEEILVYKENDNIKINSFVQIRGSIPLLWTQEPTVKLNPKIKVNENFIQNYNAFSIHINELIGRYDSVHCINLIDKKKDQQIIGKEYEKLIMEYKSKELRNGGNLEFSWFDFHSECKKMQYNNIKKLFLQENVSKNIENCKYSIIEINSKKFKEAKLKLEEEQKIYSRQEEILIQEDLLTFPQKQKVVFRTNCIDSLDRTNVVQSVFGRYFLLLILKDLNLSDVTPSKENISLTFKEGFESKFKNIWADVGDHVSLAYSGTGAMKSDFVRTGKRTIFGALNDGILTTRRLFINNFRDGYNQDCHDYFLGNLNPKKDNIKQHSLTNMYAVFVVSALISLQLTRMMTSGGFSLMNILLFLILTFIIGFSLIYSMKNQFIDYHSNHSKK